MNTPGSESIDPEQLKSGPIRHESLPAELLERIEAVHGVLGPYLGTTLEQFEISFMRDSHPEEEVVVWCSITSAWIAYHEQYLGGKYLPDVEEKRLIAALIMISTGADDTGVLGVPTKVGDELLACYAALGKD